MGENGAGHYVKMVHNGIGYGDMQLICEAYNLMKTGLGLGADQMHEVFAGWQGGELNSYLVEITRDILAYKDAERPAAGGPDPRYGRPEGDGEMDRPVAPQRGRHRAQKALRPAGAGKTQKRKSPSGIGACLARAREVRKIG